METCTKCHGKGEVPSGGASGFSAVSVSWGECPECDGSGIVCGCNDCGDTGLDMLNGEIVDNRWIPAGPCPTCKGRKVA